MSTSVGKITLELEIKTNLNKQMNSIKNQISKSIDKPMFDTAKNMSGNLSKAVDTVKNTVGKASKVISDEMSNTTGKVKDKSQEMSDEIRKAIGNFEISEDPTARLQQDLDNSKEKMSLLNAKWQELQSSLSKEDTDSGAAAVVEQLNLAERHMLDLQNTIDVTKEKLNSGIKMPELDIPAVDTDNLTESINGSTQSLNDLDVQADETGVGLKESVSKPTIDFKKLGSVVKSLGSGIKKGLSGAFNGLKAVGGKALDSLKKKLGGFKQLASGITGIFSKVGDVVKSAVIGACNSNDEFASSLNQIKANLQIAFVPIMQSIMPAINTLMAGVSQVTRVLATFTNQLFGSTYKKSLDTVKQIKDVGKEAKKNSTYLSSFDEMNVAQDNEKDNSSGGGGSGGIDYSAISGEEVELPDWAKRMKDSIKSGDWAGVGGLLAEKINKCFNIDWASIQSKVNGFITSVTSGLNGFMDKFDWAGLGSTIAGGINTVFGGMYTFMTTFDWSGLGKGIATSLNNAISKTDWGLIGKTFASKWNALIDTLFAFVTKFDFSGFGSSISKSVNAWFDEIDWAKLGKTITKSITGLLDTVLGFLETMDRAGIGESIQTFITNIDWIGIAKKVFEVIIS
ncbi:MAG: apolipoprotein A1/A4/E family protein, partial [Clostridiales bacterium]|nr:apolipoprotein A1/A4/E family protein [Clostridiales bacterium]